MALGDDASGSSSGDGAEGERRAGKRVAGLETVVDDRPERGRLVTAIGVARVRFCPAGGQSPEPVIGRGAAGAVQRERIQRDQGAATNVPSDRQLIELRRWWDLGELRVRTVVTNETAAFGSVRIDELDGRERAAP